MPGSVPQTGFTRALFVHAWDLESPGAEALMTWARDAGIDTLCLAASYHSGWLVQPHHPLRRLRLCESGAIYFHPQDALYRDTPLQPYIATMAREQDWFELAAEQARRFGLRLIAWIVGAHNTRLGLAHPELTQRNAYGDFLPHALCLSTTEVRTYLKALCRDLAMHYSPHGLQLESFHWHGVRHNHHHERDLTELNELERELLSMCFHPATMSRAREAGVDAEAARHVVLRVLEATFKNAPRRTAGHPTTMAELEQQEPVLLEYNTLLAGTADSLLEEVHKESLAGTDCRLYLQTAFQPSRATSCDGFAVWSYGLGAEQTRAAVQTARARIPEDWPGDLHCYIRLGLGCPGSEEELRAIVNAACEGGASGTYFYNYSEAPPTMLAWLSRALRDS